MSTDYETMTDPELTTLALSGDFRAEIESRHRTLRTTETIVYVCLHCGEETGRDITQARRDTGEPWRDPYAPANIKAWHQQFHHCTRRPLFRRSHRTATVRVKTPT